MVDCYGRSAQDIVESEYVPAASMLGMVLFLIIIFSFVKTVCIAYRAVNTVADFVLSLLLDITKAAVCFIGITLSIIALVNRLLGNSVVSVGRALFNRRLATAETIAIRVLSATPVLSPLMFLVPCMVVIIDSASIWVIQLPQSTGFCYSFDCSIIGFAYSGTLGFDNFSGLIAIGATVSRLSFSDAAAVEMSLTPNVVSPANIAVEYQILGPAFVSAARSADATDILTVLAAAAAAPALLTVERLVPNNSVVVLGCPVCLLTAPAPAAVESPALAANGVAIRCLSTTNDATTRIQAVYSTICKVTRMAQKPVKVQVAVPDTMAVAPRLLFVEHQAFVAAMGVVNPFALKLSLTFKSVVDSASAVPVFFGPVKPVTTQFNNTEIELFTPRVARSIVTPTVHSTVFVKCYLELQQGFDTVRTQIAALETTLLLARTSVSVCASVPASEPSLTCAPVTAPAPEPEPEPEPAHVTASDYTCEPAAEINEQASEKFTLRQKCCCACMAKEMERRAKANSKPQKRSKIRRAWQKYLLTTTTPIPFNFHESRVCPGRCEACRVKAGDKEKRL